MKIRIYKVEPPNIHDDLAHILDQIGKKPISERERDIGGKIVFLEELNKRGTRYEMDFTQRRVENGPGYSKKGKPTEDFKLEPDAGFGEQTAAIWSDEHLAVQYNHYGVRPPTIRDYLQKILHGQSSDQSDPLSIIPVVDDEVFAKFLESKQQKKFSVVVDANTISKEMADNVTLGAALNLQEATLAAKVEISISYGGNKQGTLQRIKEMAKILRKHPGVTSMKAAVKNELDAPVEVLDLMNHREIIEVPDDNLNRTDGRRFDYESRIGAIRREFSKWLRKRHTG